MDKTAKHKSVQSAHSEPILIMYYRDYPESLNMFIETFSPSVTFKLISGNVGASEGKLSLPHFLTMFF